MAMFLLGDVVAEFASKEGVIRDKAALDKKHLCWRNV